MNWYRVLCSLVVVLPWVAANTPALVAGDLPSGWVNVKECGASGSALEARAATTAGSKEITQ